MAYENHFFVTDTGDLLGSKDMLTSGIIESVEIKTTEKDENGKSISYSVPYEVIVEGQRYTFLAAGSSSAAWISEDKSFVYKEAYGAAEKEIEEKRKKSSRYVAVNDPQRLVSIHQSADPENRDQYRVVERVDGDKTHHGYIMPCLLSTEKNAKKLSLTEDQRIAAVIDFFEKTNGRILCDAYILNNLLLFNNEVRFPDVGDAFEFGLNAENEPKSPTSYHAWDEGGMRNAYMNALQGVRRGATLPRLAETIEALITLKEKFPDLCDSVSWLMDPKNSALRSRLADIFEESEKNEKLLDEDSETVRAHIIAAAKPVHKRISSVFGDSFYQGAVVSSAEASPRTNPASPNTNTVSLISGSASPSRSFAGSFSLGFFRLASFGPNIDCEPMKDLAGFKRRISEKLNEYSGTNQTKREWCIQLATQLETLREEDIDAFRSELVAKKIANNFFEQSSFSSPAIDRSFITTRSKFGKMITECVRLVDEYTTAHQSASPNSERSTSFAA